MSELASELLRVGVIGARGRMGAQTCQAVVEAEDMDLVAAVGGREWLFSLADADSQVVVDFSHPDVVMEHIRFCLDNNIHVVAGTSGFTTERLETLEQWVAAKPDLGVMVVPNFAIGAVLTARFAREAADSSNPRRSSNCTMRARPMPRPEPPSPPPMPWRWPVDPPGWDRCPMRPPWKPMERAARLSMGSRCIRCGCPGWSRTRR